jgi:hypothetical protein
MGAWMPSEVILRRTANRRGRIQQVIDDFIVDLDKGALADILELAGFLIGGHQ